MLESIELARAEYAGELLQRICHRAATLNGWHKNNPATIGDRLMLIVTEVSEAMEGHRKDLMDTHLPNRKMIEVELADVIIRVCDLAGYLDLDLGGAISEKLEYNDHREDHKIENRMKPGGKSI